MFQLKLKDDLKTIISDIPSWKNKDDIPLAVMNFINEKETSLPIIKENSGEIFCSTCFTKLDETFFCPKCHRQYEKISLEEFYDYNKNNIYVDYNDSTKYMNFDISFFVFDIVKTGVYLYLIEDEVAVYNPSYGEAIKNQDIKIFERYYVEKDGITDLNHERFIPFKLLDACNQEVASNSNSLIDDYNATLQFEYKAYLYLDNLELLKQSVYFRSKFWQLKSYLKEKTTFTLANLIFYPVYYPQFEYLVNYGLANLALDSPYIFKKGKSFQDIFNVSKKYLPMMAKNNITTNELQILYLCETNDYETLNFFGKWYDIYGSIFKTFVDDFKINLKDLKDYLFKFEDPGCELPNYIDYLMMAKELGLNVEEKKVLYPSNLSSEHDRLYQEITLIDDPDVDLKIKSIAKILTLNKYEDDEYIVYPVSSLEELIDESKQQRNCVRTYALKIASNECQIYLLRKKSEASKSLVTIEVRKDKVVQARVKYNESPDIKLQAIIKKFENHLTGVTVKD